MGIPFVNFSFIKRALNQIDIDEEDLDIDSTDKVEAELAKSSEEIDEKFSKYGKSSKAQRRETLKEVHVSQKDLKASKAKNSSSKENTKQEEKNKDDDEREM